MKRCLYDENIFEYNSNSIESMNEDSYSRALYKFVHEEINRRFTPCQMNSFKTCTPKKIMKLKYLSHNQYCSREIGEKLGVSKSYVDSILTQYNKVMLQIISFWRENVDK